MLLEQFTILEIAGDTESDNKSSAIQNHKNMSSSDQGSRQRKTTAKDQVAQKKNTMSLMTLCNTITCSDVPYTYQRSPPSQQVTQPKFPNLPSPHPTLPYANPTAEHQSISGTTTQPGTRPAGRRWARRGGCPAHGRGGVHTAAAAACIRWSDGRTRTAVSG